MELLRNNILKKQHKKIENNLIKALTTACELLKHHIDGFEWLTHFASYEQFPKSLAIVCVLSTNQQLSAMLQAGKEVDLAAIIDQQLALVGIKLKDIKQHLEFDSEEQCQLEHGGNWNKRFR